MSYRLMATLVAAATLSAAGAAQSATVFGANLLGSSEVPPNASTATGFAKLTVLGDSLQVDVTWDALIGGVPGAAHIHCCTTPGTNIGVAVGFPGFPAATSGTYSHLFDLLDPATYTSSFRTTFGGGTAAGSEAALLAGLAAGQAYVNIHDAAFPGGEIRGFTAAIPEPSTWAMMIAGFGLAGVGLRRRRSAPA
jgi:hypothetical protein